jgi:hypothetical protein
MEMDLVVEEIMAKDIIMLWVSIIELYIFYTTA